MQSGDLAQLEFILIDQLDLANGFAPAIKASNNASVPQSNPAGVYALERGQTGSDSLAGIETTLLSPSLTDNASCDALLVQVKVLAGITNFSEAEAKILSGWLKQLTPLQLKNLQTHVSSSYGSGWEHTPLGRLLTFF